MDKKAKAALKMAMGAGQVVSGAMTACGKGLLGGTCKSQGMMNHAMRYGSVCIKEGTKKFQDGLEDFKKS